MSRINEGVRTVAAAALALLCGCSATPSVPVPKGPLPQPLVQSAPKESRWYVYKDANSPENHGVWSGWMPEEAAKMVTLDMACGGGATGAAGDTSIRANVRLSSPWWCGVAVTCAEEYWGESPFGGAYDLSKATRLVFKARGEKGGESIQVKVAIAGDKPYGDSASIPSETPWLRLTKDWKVYELSVRGRDLSRVITPFCWVASRDQSGAEPLNFYLDDVHFVIEE